MQTDPFDAFDGGKPAAELRKTALPVTVRPVAGDVLGNDDQLFHTRPRKALGLAYHRLHRARAVASPDIGDCAEGTEVVAALRNAQPGPARPCGDDPGDFLHGCAVICEGSKRSPCEDGLGGRDDLREAADPEHGVNLRQLFLYLRLIALGKTAGHDDRAEPSLCLQRGML